MAINRAIVSTADITEVQVLAIEMVSTRPQVGYQDQEATPNAIVGYYDYTSDRVELYCRDATGRRVIKLV